jgi:eukaryotic-like serine/threonine-protein kinase
MDSRYRRSEDQTLAGAGSAIKEASSFGTSIPSPLYAGGAPTGTGGTGAAVARAAINSSAILEPGTLLGGRYEIISTLGLGGMGAVYKAYDRDIEIEIAVKVIRPDLASNPELLQRFKQELLLARQITHRNVVRIFDVRESGGLKFITMEYIDGRDLGSLLAEHGKLPPSEALDIMMQACAGLAAAHAEGVIHRDLKPGNIMRDKKGRVVVMDFGLARTLDGGGMTQTGAMLGTIEYMSPEQAKAESLDERSDLFTIGLILYELITGKTPYQADSAIASLLKRTQERAISISEIDANVSRSLSAVVARCLETDPKNRYQTVTDVIIALEEVQGKRPPSVFAEQKLTSALSRWIMIGLATVAVIAIAALATVVLVRSRSAPTVHKTVTVLLAEFENSTGDSIFDGTLESSFGLAIEAAPFVNAYNRGQAHKIVGQVKAGATALDEANSRLVASREGISVVISGAVAKKDDGYKLTCKAIDALTGKTIGSSEVEASNKGAVLNSLGTLANKMRDVLGDTTPESVKLAQAETFTSSSLEAAHAYGVAQDLRYAGKNDEAIKAFVNAIQLDPTFGSAFAGVAAMYANQGDRENANKHYKLAMEHVDRMTDREKFRTRGGYYLFSMNAQKAIEEFSTLVEQYPADTMGHSSLAYAYSQQHDQKRALEEAYKALAIYPKYVPYHGNVSLYAVYAGDFATAEKEARIALELNPGYAKAYFSLGFAQIAAGKFQEAADTYQKLAGVNTLGASLAADGLADLALYQSRAGQAVTVLDKGIQQDLAQKDDTNAAKKYAMLAEAQLMAGKASEAVSSLDKAVTLKKEAVLFPAARFYVEAGQDGKAASLAADLGRKLEPVPQAYAKIIAADISLRHAQHSEAIRQLQEAQQISDTWIGRFDLARAYIAAGDYTEGDSELSTCLKRRGEATDVYLDVVPTFHYFPATYYYIGRDHEGLKAPDANDSYRTFLSLKWPEAQDPLVLDASRRLH